MHGNFADPDVVIIVPFHTGRKRLVLIREFRPTILSDRLRARMDNREEKGVQLRDYGVGAQILRDLGVREMILVYNTTRTIIAL